MPLLSGRRTATSVLASLALLGMSLGKEFEISYVIEPFEAENITQSQGWFTTDSALDYAATKEESLFGNASLRIDLEPLPPVGTFGFGWTSPEGQPLHNCIGATHLSLWYRLKTTTFHVTGIQLSLTDDSNQTGNYHHDTADSSDNHQWQEILIDLDNDLMPFNTGQIRGWQVEVEVTSASVDPEGAQAILFDQLACVGGGEMLGNPLRLDGKTWDQAVREGNWREEYYQSDQSASQSELELRGDDTFAVNYTIEQTEDWGGFMSVEFVAPGHGYYNLSGATDVYFQYEILQASSAPGRAHLRLILTESSETTACSDQCSNDWERWYAFNYILDETSGTSGVVDLPLEGSEQGGVAPFWLPGWSGGVGNRQLDVEHIKGMVLEFSVDSQGDKGSLVHGMLDIHGMAAQFNEEEQSKNDNNEPFEISYVMEPFEWKDDDWFVHDNNTNLNITLTQPGEGLFGNSSLLVGFDFEGPATAEFGVLNPNAPFNCYGATHLSIWYRLNETLATSMPEILLRLVDDDGDSKKVHLERYTTIRFPAPQDDGWHEFRIPTEQMKLDNDVGGNGWLDLNRLRGWSIAVTGASTTGALEVDQLACIGGEALIGSSFHIGLASFEEALEKDVWSAQFYQSELSENETSIGLEEGAFRVDYTVQQVESWGGFIGLGSQAPGPAYYNLSRANYLNLRYKTRQPASVPGRLHLRLILNDRSDVCSTCSDYERWYNFNYVLDENQTTGEIQIPLEGSTDASSPFWFTGWAGGVGNMEFDKDHIKGFLFEFSVDSQGDLGSTVSGAVDLFDLSASKTKDFLSLQGQETSDEGILVEEHDLYFDTSSPRFRRREFLGNQCAETCASDPTCLYALSTGSDCYTASSLAAGDVTLANTVALRRDVTAFWLDGRRRGDFCEVCECLEADRTIDCHSRDLKTAPKIFRLPWHPRTLDLRNNSNLLVLGYGALDEIADSLEELWLPEQMAYVSPDLNEMPALSAIHWGGPSKVLSNVILRPDGAFSDVCCSQGRHTNLTEPSAGMTFCQMDVKRPGSDSTYAPFLNYFDGSHISIIRPNSDFMSEAADSVEKCAEYCSIVSDCKYFSYDARFPQAEHVCYLRRDNGTIHRTVCCEADHYADEDKLLPGWTSGMPPRTRNEVDNARVLIGPQLLVVDPSNGYEAHYDLHLGSMPLRGAVWIEPSILVETSGLDVVFQPERVVLYDSISTVRVTVTVSVAGVDLGRKLPPLLVHNSITSCDQAFMESSDAIIADRDTTVFIDIILPEVEDDSIAWVILAVSVSLAIVTAIVLFIYFDLQRKSNDAIWEVKRSELVFGNPPEIVGRGSYGLVLKAEYRGTAVAVKRVIPPKQKKTAAGAMDDSTGHKFSGSYEIKPEESVRSKPSTTLGSFMMSIGGNSISGTRSRHSTWKKRKEDFMKEMRHLSKLRHPCITTVMGAVVGKTEPMLVMELMHHGSLYDLLHNETMILDAELILPLLRDISQGMRFLHSSKPTVVHADLKSQNILVDKNFRAKVADFGLSQRKMNVAAGTPLWMAPELLRGECSNTAASDVYSFGIILYEVYSRKEPYCGEEVEEVLRLVADKTMNKRPEIPKNMPPSVQAFMTDCLVAEPEQRPTFTELDQRLQRVDEKNLETPNNLRSSRRRANISLDDIFPKHIADALAEGRKVEAQHRDCVTIFFSDIVGFTNISSTLEPVKIAGMLDRLYTKFDNLSHKHDIYKVETIGDAYMAVSN